VSAELVAAGRTSRVPAALLLVATLVGAPLTGAILGNVVDPGLGALVGVVGFVSLLAFVIVTIARSSSALRRLSPAASQGDVASVLPPARSTLRWVFRGDLRSGALCALALAAEARGDVSAAAELFARAERALPAGLPSRSKGRLGALLASHLALALAALGRVDEARAALGRAHASFRVVPSVLDGLDGLGNVFGVLDWVEPGRDPRALAVLAGMMLAHADGARRDVLDLALNERWNLDRGLLPRERRLATALELRARAELDGGMMRVALDPALAEGEGEWAAGVLGARSASRA